MSDTVSKIESRLPHRIACLLACIVFPLIWVGNLVTTTDAGMAVPDWPNTYGYNLFLYPYREWFFGPWDLFVEHGHRLLASLAGLIAIVLVVVSVRKERRTWVQKLAWVILILVVAQGILGGIRVVYDARWIAKVHGCIGPFFFATVVAFCVATSRWWFSSEGLANASRKRLLRWVPRLALVLLCVSYMQLVLGAFVRHIDDFASAKQFTLLIAMHVLTAVILVIGTLVQFFLTRRADLRSVGVKASINALTLLVLLQFSLGLGTWIVKWGFPSWFENQPWAANFVIAEKSFFQVNVVTAHAAIGSLILAFWVIHAMRTKTRDKLEPTNSCSRIAGCRRSFFSKLSDLLRPFFFFHLFKMDMQITQLEILSSHLHSKDVLIQIIQIAASNDDKADH